MQQQTQKIKQISQHNVQENAGQKAYREHHDISPELQMQRTIGNHGVLHRLGLPVQPKLKVNEPDDLYEQEADRVADRVMRMSEPAVQRQAEDKEEEEEKEKEETIQAKPISEQITPLVQRQAAEEEEEPIQTKPVSGIAMMVQRQTEDEEEEETPVQTKISGQQSLQINRSLETQIQSIRGSGQPLSAAGRAFFEPRFGRDFSEVRLHTDTHSADTARAINSRAFTVRRDIVFGAGQYAPEIAEGKRLLAHELTHVIQQQAMVTGSVASRHMLNGLTTVYRKPVSTEQKKKSKSYSYNTAVIKADILEKYPWVARIKDKDKTLNNICKIVKNRHKIQDLQRRYGKVAGSILSEDVEKAIALTEQILDLQYENKILNLPEKLDIIPLLHSDVYPEPGKGSADVGKMALLEDLKKRQGYLQVDDHEGLTEADDSLTLYLYPGWDVAVQPDGIHYKTLMQNESLNIGVVYVAIAREILRTWDEFVQKNPWVKVELAKAELAEAKAKELETPTVPEEERVVKEIIEERRRYATEIREAYVEAGQVPVAIMSLFVPSGPVELLLMVTPVSKLGKAGKLGKKLFDIFRSGKKAKIAAKEIELFISSLDKEAHVFLRLAERLPKSERVAVMMLHSHGASPALIKNLMVRSAETGTAELGWIVKMLKKGKMDIQFVERFARYEANPRWDILQRIVTKSGKVPAEERAQLVKVVKGLLGEEAALKILKKEGLEILETGYRYGGKKSLDIVASTKKSTFLFGEVKNWGIGSWSNSAARSGVLEQLVEHNNGINKFLKKVRGTVKDIENKLLMVEEKGFLGLDASIRADFTKKVKDLGWEIKAIPSASIENFKAFIDRLR